MFTLKNYQNNALRSLKDFFEAKLSRTNADAFQFVLSSQDRAKEKYTETFAGPASICLRVPTGGGKTIMAATAIGMIAPEVGNKEYPVVLWLTPSDTIRVQTMTALSNPKHPYRQAIAQSFGDRVKIVDLDSLQTINPQDIGKDCLVVVSTIQALNVSDTNKRNVYSFYEELAPHFDNLSSAEKEGLEKVKEEDLTSQPYLTKTDIGRVKYSIANWLYLQNPIVIVDEAHNNKTERFFKTLNRLNPACVVEFTATPVEGNNVLYSVSAMELKAEEMIKLPVILAEHLTGWQDCVRDASLTRERLELIAQKEADYIRPILLIQAMAKGGEATVDVVRKYLIEDLKIEENQIAVATGDQKELDGINLFDRNCPIRFVITIEALKEGWDCSFAYVLASLQNVRSSTSVEQLLGRVLRMPYAKERSQEPLNKAYAHIVASSFSDAASALRDRMVQNMGFERLEAAALVVPGEDLGLEDTGGTPAPKIPECVIEISSLPDLGALEEATRNLVQVSQTSQGATVVISPRITLDQLTAVENHLTSLAKPKEKEVIASQFQAHRAIVSSMSSPANLGETFPTIPQLCFNLDGDLILVEQETLAELVSWDLLDAKIQLENFSLSDDLKVFEIDLNGEKLVYQLEAIKQLELDDVQTHLTVNDLIYWLDKTIRNPSWGLSQQSLQNYLTKLVRHLMADRGFSLTALVRGKVPLSKAIPAEINRLKAKAIANGHQSLLPGMTLPSEQEMPFLGFRFEPGLYPARNLYQGRYRFAKHFYPVIHDLKEKRSGGEEAEEFKCARAIDSHPKVKTWIRNIERQPKLSFKLPTSTDYFYPDFIAELTDGRILVVEYKGEPYKTNDDSREKIQIGSQWEKSSDGKCLFLFAVEKDDDGRGVIEQLNQKIG